MVDKLTHIRRAEIKLRAALDRDPTDDELAQELQITPRRVNLYRQASRAPVSLDAPVGDDESSRISEVVADHNAAAPFDRVVNETDNELVREALATLTAREREILALRFGLGNGNPKTLEEVGAHLGVTRERIRQIQEQVLKKLRAEIDQKDGPSIPEPAEFMVAA